MTTRLAAWAACGLSIGVLVSCMLFVPLLWGKLAEIRQSSRMDLEEFRVLEAQVWQEVSSIRRNAPRSRPARQAAGICRKFG